MRLELRHFGCHWREHSVIGNWVPGHGDIGAGDSSLLQRVSNTPGSLQKGRERTPCEMSSA